MEAFIFGVIFLTCIFSIKALCKFEIFNLTKHNDGGFIGFLKIMTPLGLGLSASIFANFMYVLSNADIIFADFMYALSNVEIIDTEIFLFVGLVVICTLAQIIGFTIFFYIAYGVLSLVKFFNDYETARRNVAGLITVIVNFVCIFIDSQL